MNETLFRKSSLDRVSSPEQLDDYIRVTGPSLWVVLAAAVILLAAALVWGIFGNLPTSLTAMGYAKGGTVTCYLSPEDAAKVRAGMAVRAGETEWSVQSVSDTPLSLTETATALGGDYLAKELAVGDWNVPVTVSAPGAPDGVVQVRITVDSIHPIKFILN